MGRDNGDLYAVIVALVTAIVGFIGIQWFDAKMGFITLVGILASAYLFCGWMTRRNYRYATPSAPITSLNQFYNGAVSLVIMFFLTLIFGVILEKWFS